MLSYIVVDHLFLGFHNTATLRLECCKTLAAYVPFSKWPVSTGSFEKISCRSKVHVFVRDYHSHAYKTCGDMAQGYKERKEAHRAERTPSLPSLTGGDDHKFIQQSENNDLSYPLTSNSPLLLETIPDSTCSSGKHSPTKVVTGSPLAPEREMEDNFPSSRLSYTPNGHQSKFKIRHWNTTPRTMQLPRKPSQSSGSSPKFFGEQKEKLSSIDEGSDSILTKRYEAAEKSIVIDKVNGTHIGRGYVESEAISQSNLRKRLGCIYERVLVVDTISAAKAVVSMLTNQYRDMVHACDTEVCLPFELLLDYLQLDTVQLDPVFS